MSNYKMIARHYSECFKQHGDNNLGVDWPNYNDTLKRYEIMLGLTKGDDCSLLDFGCGLGHFYDYLIENNIQDYIQYSGLDINKEMIALCKYKYPKADFFQSDILRNTFDADQFDMNTWDYIIANGVFTEKRELSQEEMLDFFHKTITQLWKKSNKGIAFNVMSKIVDWERDDLFHVSMDELGSWICKNLSRNFIIRNDYGLYEYSVYIYK